MVNEMFRNWNTRALEEVAEIIDSLHQTPLYEEHGFPMVRVTDIKGGYLSLTECKHVSEIVFRDFTRRYKPRFGDVIISRVGTYGMTSYVYSDDLFCLGQNTAAIRPKINSRYLYYCLQSPDLKRQIDRIAVGSTQKTISLKNIKTLRIPVPPKEQMKQIVRILGALDDKIELNRKMNVTLEALARALFQSWFVDFDPVRAKAEGRVPQGMDAATAALFPDGFEESALGAVPRGWKLEYMREVAQFIKGISYKSEHLQDSHVALVTLKSIDRGGGYRDEGLKPYTGEFKPEQQVRSGEIIVAHTDLTQAAEVLGRPAIVREHPAFSTLIASLDLMIVRPSEPWMSNEFLYDLLSRDEFQEHAYGYSNGTTVLHLSVKALPRYQFILPHPNIVQAYTSRVRASYQLCEKHENQSRTLTVIRDALLPKLLSGEIRVGEMEQIVEKVI